MTKGTVPVSVWQHGGSNLSRDVEHVLAETESEDGTDEFPC